MAAPVPVAVIGTGLAGLATAYLLTDTVAAATDGSLLDFDVHLFERNASLGMDTASLSVKDVDGTYRVDVPMRSINRGSHSRVHKLYTKLGVPLVKSDFTYSFSRLSSDPMPAGTSATLSSSLPSTPPPEYCEEMPTRTPTPACPDPADPVDDRAGPPMQTTALLYEGASGLRFPPAAIPSHLRAAPLRRQGRYILDVVLIALTYLYLVVLALTYCALGLAYPPSSPAPSSRLTTRLLHRFTAHLAPRNIASEPLLAWCARHRLPKHFSEDVLVPLMAAVATVGIVEARTMPVGEVLQYVASTLLASHYVTHPSFGVRGIVAALVAPLPPSHIHLGVSITSLSRLAEGGGYAVHYRLADGASATFNAAHVVLATQADQAARLLATLAVADQPAATLEALEAFTYVRTLVVTHTDARVLPTDARDRRDLNLAVFARHVPGKGEGEGEGEGAEPGQGEWDEGKGHLPPSSVQTTHILSPRSPGGGPPVLQTTNPLVPIAAADTLGATWFSRAFVTPRSQAAVSALAAQQGVGGLWLAGSYLASGIPLLEGCVTSAESVVQGLVARQGGRVQRPGLLSVRKV
ncbi:hypothetical protein JCM3770_003164 [Rhodotorula araucariae]